MRGLRQAICEQRLQEYVAKFMLEWFGSIESVPSWIIDALHEAKISINP